MPNGVVSEPPSADARIQLGWGLPPVPGIGFATAQPLASSPQPIHTDPEGHLMTFAPTGAGKGVNVIMPTLLSYRGSVLVIDPKGEAAAITARHRRRFGQVVIIDPFHVVTEQPDSLNPLHTRRVIRTTTEAAALMMAELLHGDVHTSLRDAFWDNRGDALLSGLIAYVLEHEASEAQHFGTLRKHLSRPSFTHHMYKLLEKIDDGDSYAAEEIGQFLSVEAEVTQGGILSTAQQHVKLFGDPDVVKSISTTSFDLRAFKEGEPISIYLVLPPAKLLTHGVLLRLWVGSLITVLLERDYCPETPNLFLIDEAAQLGSLNALRTAMTLLRGYGLRCWTFWQDFHQVQRLYRDDWQALVNNAAYVQTFGINKFLSAKSLAEMMGNVSPDDLLNLTADEQMILLSNGRAEKARRLNYLSEPQFEGLYDPNPRFKRRPNPLPLADVESRATLNPGEALDQELATRTGWLEPIRPFSTHQAWAKSLLNFFLCEQHQGLVWTCQREIQGYTVQPNYQVRIFSPNTKQEKIEFQWSHPEPVMAMCQGLLVFIEEFQPRLQRK